MPTGISGRLMCSVPDCGRQMAGHGFCQSHLRRWKLTGEIGGPIRQTAQGSPIERFWSKVDKNGPIPEYAPHLGQCWLWTAYSLEDYGRFMLVRGRSQMAHRISYETSIGPVPEGLVLDHLCRVRRCVRPSHLEPVTNAENNERGMGNPWLINKHKTRCIRDHPFDAGNTRINHRGARICLICQTESNRRVDEQRRLYGRVSV